MHLTSRHMAHSPFSLILEETFFFASFFLLPRLLIRSDNKFRLHRSWSAG